MRRLEVSAVTGLVTAAALTGFADKQRHAQLAASVASSTAHGQPESVTSVLVTAFVIIFLAVTAIVYAGAALVAYRRRRRLAAGYGTSGYRGGW